MSEWTTTLTTVATLIAGGGLTMIGQALADRRARRREREGDERKFQIQYFTMHQEALMKLQELAQELSNKLRDEHSKRLEKGEYKYFDSRPKRMIADKMMESLTALSRIRPLLEQMNVTDSKEELANLRNEVNQFLVKGVEASKVSVEEFQHSLGFINKRIEFMEQISPLFQNIIMTSCRTGSRSVMVSAKIYVKVAIEYDCRLVTKDSEKFSHNKSAALIHLQGAISKALKDGPFD